MTRLTLRARFVPSLSPLLGNSLLSAALCLATAVCVHAQSQQQTGDESWSTTKESSALNVNSSRTTESHTKSGNRTVDKQRLEALSPNGGYQPLAETETETIQVNDTTTRTVVRTYQWNANGQRTLTQMTEEDSRIAANGNAHIERKTSAADVNGSFQVIQREVADTKKISSGVEETKTTVYKRDSYGGLAQTEQRQEVKTQGPDDSVAVKKTSLVPDGNGSWRVSGVAEKTIKNDGNNRTTEERVSSPDVNGNLNENLRTVSKENDTDSGEKRSIVETYDGGTQLSKRVSTTRKKDSGGEVTEEQVEQPNAGNPSDGTRVTSRTKYVVKYASSGSQQTTQKTTTSEIRDANGNFKVVSADTQKSTQPPSPPAPPKPDAPAPPKPDAPKP
jgi:hypothetical protein